MLAYFNACHFPNYNNRKAMDYSNVTADKKRFKNIIEDRPEQHISQLQQEQQEEQEQEQEKLIEKIAEEKSVTSTYQTTLIKGNLAEMEREASTEFAYDADVDDNLLAEDSDRKQMYGSAPVDVGPHTTHFVRAGEIVQSEKDHIFELFQPWALKTYGDQAKTKTITMRKKARILKALEGKEQNRPDSSKFRFWVKSKAFTTKRPEGFEEAPGSQRRAEALPPYAVLSENPSVVDLFVASTSKGFGERNYRKVAVVEEFFDIIYNVHMELGGRSGMHAGQKRTYRIITETYAFLPREAVTRFLSICPECKKNLRPSSPPSSIQLDEPANESSSELEVLNYSTQTESSIETTAAAKGYLKLAARATLAAIPTAAVAKKHQRLTIESGLNISQPPVLEALVEQPAMAAPRQSISEASFEKSSSLLFPIKETLLPKGMRLGLQHILPASVPKIRINPQLQRPVTPPTKADPLYAYHPLCFNMSTLKTQDSLFRYYNFLREFYTSGDSDLLPTTSTAPSLSPLPTSSSVSLSATELHTHHPIFDSDSINSIKFSQTGFVCPCPASTTPSINTSTVLEKKSGKRSSPKKTFDSEDKNLPRQEPLPKRFKTSPDTATCFLTQQQEQALQNQLEALSQEEHHSFLHSLAIPQAPIQTQVSAINLTKNISFRANGRSPPSTSSKSGNAAASPPSTSVKLETTSTPTEKTSPQQLRIPQARLGVQSCFPPPLDLERLKPITSTYLQLTRSMGLSDEDALRFDSLVSEDFEYSL